MKIAIVGDPARKKRDEPVIQKAENIAEKFLYVPITELRIETGGKGEETRVLYNKANLSRYDVVLPIPTSKYIDMFISLINALSKTDVYIPYSSESLLLFDKKILALAKLREANFKTISVHHCISPRPIENIIPSLKFPITVVIGSKSSKVDRKHLAGVLRLRRPGQGITIKNVIKGPITGCLVVKDDVIATVNINIDRKRKVESTNIGTKLKEISINAIKILGSDFGFISFSDNKIVNISLSPDFSEIEKATSKDVSSALITHLQENIKVKKTGFWGDKIKKIIKKE